MFDMPHIIKEINPNASSPLYQQLKKAIMIEIKSGKLKPGDEFPSEKEIMADTGLSRVTVRQALNAIAAEGYLDRKRGKGTYVTRPKLEANFIAKLESFHSEMERMGIRPSTRVLRLEIIGGDPSINEVLKMPPDQPLVIMERLCLGDDEPEFYQISYLPANRFAGIIHENMEEHSLYQLLNSRFGAKVSHVNRRIDAINAGTTISELLNISRNAAVCRVENIAYDQNESPVEYNFSYYRGDRNKFTMDMYAT